MSNYLLDKPPLHIKTLESLDLIPAYKFLIMFLLMALMALITRSIFWVKDALFVNYGPSYTDSDNIFQMSSAIFKSGLFDGYCNSLIPAEIKKF